MTPTFNASAAPGSDELRRAIRDVPDFPKPGIVFKDITPLLADGRLFRGACEAMTAPFRAERIDVVAAVESRGFLLGGPIANALGVGIVPIRKVGKLPYTTRRLTYALEYGSDSLEIHDDAVSPGQRVLIVDDVIATGGTARATAALVRRLGGTVHGLAFLIELVALNGRTQLPNEQVFSVLKY